MKWVFFFFRKNISHLTFLRVFPKKKKIEKTFLHIKLFLIFIREKKKFFIFFCELIFWKVFALILLFLRVVVRCCCCCFILNNFLEGKKLIARERAHVPRETCEKHIARVCVCVYNLLEFQIQISNNIIKLFNFRWFL